MNISDLINRQPLLYGLDSYNLFCLYLPFVPNPLYPHKPRFGSLIGTQQESTNSVVCCRRKSGSCSLDDVPLYFVAFIQLGNNISLLVWMLVVVIFILGWRLLRRIDEEGSQTKKQLQTSDSWLNIPILSCCIYQSISTWYIRVIRWHQMKQRDFDRVSQIWRLYLAAGIPRQFTGIIHKH